MKNRLAEASTAVGLRKILTPPERARESYPGLGVGVFVRDARGRVLVIREHKAKDATNRRAGEYGVVCETLEPGESYTQAAVRGLGEELGIPLERISELFSIVPDTAFVGEGHVSNWYARLYEVEFHGVDEDLRGSTDGEVSIAGWYMPRFLEQLPLREATRLMLESYLPVAPSLEAQRIPLSVETLSWAEENAVAND
jgi:ADP-ribose pyrophosphatase YjhB (NUDIX family)